MKRVFDVAHTALALTQHVQDSQPLGVHQDLEQFGCLGVVRSMHSFIVFTALNLRLVTWLVSLLVARVMLPEMALSKLSLCSFRTLFSFSFLVLVKE